MKKRAEERANRKKVKDASRVGVGTIKDKKTVVPTTTKKVTAPTTTTPKSSPINVDIPETKKTTPDKKKTQAEKTVVKYTDTKKPPTTKSRAGGTQEEREARFREKMADRKAAQTAKQKRNRAAVKNWFGGVVDRSKERAAKQEEERKARNQARKDKNAAADAKRTADAKERKRKEEERPIADWEKRAIEQARKNEANIARYNPQINTTTAGMKKGGLVKKKPTATRTKKKGIDGIAIRGKTRAARSR